MLEKQYTSPTFGTRSGSGRSRKTVSGFEVAWTATRFPARSAKVVMSLSARTSTICRLYR